MQPDKIDLPYFYQSPRTYTSGNDLKEMLLATVELTLILGQKEWFMEVTDRLKIIG
ncbi:hypothetical protein [Bacillus cihuensis]|uniref:hypothetical protein n=1 Tax=Bacillus cihuensis TaxID=1208599 RepID=UPI000406CF50|nr:hypothetical protein [Bacillus cihuensis]